MSKQQGFSFNEDELRVILQESDNKESKELREKFKRYYDGFWE